MSLGNTGNHKTIQLYSCLHGSQELDSVNKISYTGQKRLGIINFSIILSGILNLTMYFNTSAYVAIIWLSFDKKLMVLSKSQTD